MYVCVCVCACVRVFSKDLVCIVVFDRYRQLGSLSTHAPFDCNASDLTY